MGWTWQGGQAWCQLGAGQPLAVRHPPCVSQGNQMSITFLEPAYPAPGHVHRGQLLLVEVSRAGLGPRQRTGSQLPCPVCMAGNRQGQEGAGRWPAFLVTYECDTVLPRAGPCTLDSDR